MLLLMVVDGGSVSVTSAEPAALIESAGQLQGYRILERDVANSGFVMDADSAGGKVVFTIGEELLDVRRMEKGAITTLPHHGLSAGERAKISNYLDRLVDLLVLAGHKPEKEIGVVINNFN
jgi:hypothetical protein